MGPSPWLVCNKVGFDASIPLSREEGFIRTRIPGISQVRLEDYIETTS